ncbi:diguanylate cyclase domain-containing protein [Motiliproteus sp.]|uniref:diguanylate cyclase domain-containing protein n=1 Tax=Motiliproteus sp. TaxID=1898955 RepID=UPI003BAD5439
MASADYSHLVHIKDHSELALYELIPNVVWVFDIDRHGWWWGNQPALDFWKLDCLDDLINKDLSDDSQGARDRTVQTFDLAAKNGLTIDPWTTYPNGKPKTLHMMHRAVLIGPERHRAIIAYINEEVNLGESPENLLLAEAMRYTSVLVTSFTLEGMPVVENPAATQAYKSLDPKQLPDDVNMFTARFAVLDEGKACMQRALDEQGGRWTYDMQTDAGLRKHTLDIRMTRHPLNGDWLFMVAEYDVTQLHQALDAAHEAKDELHRLAHYDALTGLPSLRLLEARSQSLIAQAERHGQQLAVMFIDLDGFKAVNDTWGHDAGDGVLKEVALRLETCLRDSDHVARVGGDEFIAMITDITSPESVEVVARKIIERISLPFALKESNEQAQIGASVGIAFYPQQGRNMEMLIKAADRSMYRVKKQGKGDVTFA